MSNPNLKRYTSSEAREYGRLGGIKSGEKKRERRKMREAAEILLNRDYEDDNGETVDGTMLLMAKVFKKAAAGDLKSIEFIRDITGQRPTIDQPELISEETRNHVMALLLNDDDD